MARCGFVGICLDDQLEHTRQRIAEALYYLGRIQPLPEPQFKPIEDTNWAEAWKQHYRPIAIGQRLLIIPAWLDHPTGNRIPIRIDPGMAFGTGTHPTTQLSLEMLEDHLHPGADLLDVGCGSGILSIAGLKLGAARALGVDTDPDAISAARENAHLNQVADRAAFAVGSIDAIQQGVFPVKQAPFVVANILAYILIRLLDAGLGELIAPGGRLLLSGILEEQFSEIETALHKHALTICEKRQIEDWIALVVEVN